MLERVWRKRNPLTLLVGMQTSTAIWRTVWRFLKKLKIELPYDPAISLQGIQPVNLREIRISLGNPEEILRIPEESYAPLSVGFCRKEYWSGLPFLL